MSTREERLELLMKVECDDLDDPVSWTVDGRPITWPELFLMAEMTQEDFDDCNALLRLDIELINREVVEGLRVRRN